jgi:non-ribosomal peptide synthase protein (TIGR01720 family)
VPAAELPSLRVIATGADFVPAELVDRWASSRTLVNCYGPTEATVNVTMSGPLTAGAGVPPIGTPLWNTRVHVLDAALRPVPTMVPGELYIAGDSLATGYLNRPALTAERFVPDPFGAPGTRLYRTGDLARRRKDGSLEFVGRADDQVKIRGLRIELGEIQAVLAHCAGVAHAAVIVREDQPGARRLVGYVVAEEDHEINHGALRERLAEALPDYMVPSAFITLDALPLTRNGKLDRSALPAPERPAEGAGRAPKDAREDILATLFAELLGLAEVGADESFFELGGDSIMSIQLVSRARSAGMALGPRDVFKHKTVAQLAAVARPVDDEPALEEPGAGIGELSATPIMRWLAELGGPVDRFSQHALIQTPSEVDEAGLGKALQAVLDHHDALRMRAGKTDAGEWTCTVQPPGSVRAEDVLRSVDIAGWSAEQVRTALLSSAQDAAERLAPAAGHMVSAIWFDAGEDPGRLVLVLNHLVADGISWRVVLPDLAAAWQDVSAGRTPKLQPVGTSLRRWAGLLEQEARAPERVAELPAWQEILSTPDRVLADCVLDPAVDVNRTVQRMTVTLSAKQTTPVLTSIPAAFHAGPDDVLLTALVLALLDRQRRTGDVAELLVDMEGHGRDEIGESPVDLSRTVGWFTTMRPARLDPGVRDWNDLWSGGRAAGTALRQIKEQVRSVPDKGTGYGLLRYLNPGTAPELARFARPRIGFNYLGRVPANQDVTDWGLAREASDVPGASEPDAPVAHVLDLNVVTLDRADGPHLVATWSWPERLLSERDVRALADAWTRALTAFANHEQAPETGGYTPSDLSLVSMSQDEISLLETEWRTLR